MDNDLRNYIDKRFDKLEKKIDANETKLSQILQDINLSPQSLRKDVNLANEKAVLASNRSSDNKTRLDKYDAQLGFIRWLITAVGISTLIQIILHVGQGA